jgi:hypothetical protein
VAKIILQIPDNPYHCILDTDVMDVELRDVFLGVRFITEDGEMLSVCMRDGGFEVHYTGNFGDKGFDAGWFEFKGSHVNQRGA